MATIGIAQVACAQNIVSRLGSGAPVLHTPGTDFEINVGDLPAGSVNLLRIYDDTASSAALASLSVGAVTVRGTAQAGAKLKIMVARSDALEFIETVGTGVARTDPRRLISAGVYNFGIPDGIGLVVTNPTNDPTETSLRDATVLVISAQNDIRGSIEVGRVFRIQALGSPASPTAQGTIYSNITTHGAFSGFDYADDAVEMVIARRGIVGNITATGGFFDNQPTPVFHQASIGRVAVGTPVQDQDVPLGIQGDIKARDGHIGFVYTTGPIGAPGHTVNIWAGAGISEIRAVQEDFAFREYAYPTRAKTVDFRADIRANWDANLPDGRLPLTGIPQLDGPLQIIQTDGAFYGSIAAGNIVSGGRLLRDPDTGDLVIEPFTNRPYAANPNFHSGVLVRGIVDAPINIDWKVAECDIVGREFPQPITIGVSTIGVIVATGRDTPNASTLPPTGGDIASLIVGYRVFDPVPTPGTPLNSYYEAPKGFLGKNSDRIMPSAQWTHPANVPPEAPYFPEASWLYGYTPDTWLYGALNDMQIIETSTSLGTPDSLIRARNIGHLYLKQMRVHPKKYPPRVEAISIPDLVVGDLREGVIWSGVYEWETQYIGNGSGYNAVPATPTGSPDSGATGCGRTCFLHPENDYIAANDYTVLSATSIGCIGAQGHVWFVSGV